MKLFKLLLVVMLFSCNDDSTEAPETGATKQIIVEMIPMDAMDVTDVAGTYTLENNKEYGVREDGKYKIELTKSKYIDKEGKEKEVLSYSILDVANKKYLYYTEKIDVAKRLERDWEYYDQINNPEITDKQLICKSHLKEEEK